MLAIIKEGHQEWDVSIELNCGVWYHLSHKDMDVFTDLRGNIHSIGTDHPIENVMPLYWEAKAIIAKYKESRRKYIRPTEEGLIETMVLYVNEEVVGYALSLEECFMSLDETFQLRETFFNNTSVVRVTTDSGRCDDGEPYKKLRTKQEELREDYLNHMKGNTHE